MCTGITRENALKLLNEHIKQPNLIKHSLASEAVMAALAEKLGENREKWAMAGLLHDLDVEITNADLNIHGNEKAFAASVNRDIIRECELINLPLEEFAQICLNAMKTISVHLDYIPK